MRFQLAGEEIPHNRRYLCRAGQPQEALEQPMPPDCADQKEPDHDKREDAQVDRRGFFQDAKISANGGDEVKYLKDNN